MAQIILNVDVNTKDVSAAVSTIKTQFSSLSQSLSSLTVNKDLTSQLKALASAYKQIAATGKGVTDVVSPQQTSAAVSNIDTLRKGYANLANQLKTLKEQYPAGVFAKADQQIQKNLESVKALSKAYKSGNWGDEERKELRALSEEYKSLAADVAQVRFEENKLATSEPFSPKQGDSIFRLQKRYSALLTAIKSVEQYYPKGTFDQITTGAQEAVPALKALGQEYVTTGTLSDNSQKKLNTFTSAIHQQEAAFKDLQATSTNYHGTLRDLIAGFAKFQLTAMLVMQPLNLLRNALQSINETLVETEDAVISIQRVLDENIAAGTISNEIYRIAQELGQTFDVVQEIAQNFAKAGLNWQETLQATEAAVLALNVAELSAAESSEGLIAIMQQFGYEASQLTYVIDVLNIAADKSAVDTQELLVALQKTGSYAKTANLSLEQTVALITAMSEATAASGQNIGNALKSLFAYTTKDSALDVFAALSTDSAAVVAEYRKGAASILDVWKQVASELDNLNAEQGSLLDRYFATEEGSALEEELSGELQGVYDDIKGIYDTAGVYRKNYFLALLGNMEEVEKVLDVVGDAAGYTMTEQEKYMDTYTAKLNALQSQWESLITDEQGWLSFKKWLVDLGSVILSIMEWTGGLRTTLLALGTAIATVFGQDVISKIQNGFAAIRAGFSKTATAAQKLNTALGVIGLIATAVSAVSGFISQALTEARQKAEESAQKQAEAENEAIAVANDASEAYQESARVISEYSQKVEELRNVLDSTTSTDAEKVKAQNELLEIQNALIESNSDYADSLDLINGSIKEQLDLIEQLSDKQLKEQAQKFLTENEAAINIAESRLNSDSTSTISGLFNGTFFEGTWLQDKLYQIISEAGVEGIQVVMDSVAPGLGETWDNIQTDFSEGDIWGALGGVLTTGSILNFLNEEHRTGSSSAGIEVAGTIEEQIDALEALKESIALNEKDLLTDEEVVGLTSAIQDQIDTLNSAEYQEAQLLAKRAQATQDYISGAITRAEYLEIVYGIEQDITDETNEQIDAIEELTDEALDDLIDALEKVRDLTDEAAKLDEKRLAIQEAQADVIDAQNDLLKAQQALENAKNSRTVRRLNSRTGEFEWVADEDKIAEAEEEVQDALDNLAKAQEDVADAIKDYNDYIRDQAFDAVIDELESGNATNDSILAIIEEWAAKAYGTETPAWVEEIINAIKEWGVDLNGEEEEDPLDSTGNDSSTSGEGNSNSTKKPTKRWTSYQDVVNDGFGSLIMPEDTFNRRGGQVSGGQKYGSYQEYLDAMNAAFGGNFDKGGLAYGRGIMVKDTDKPEAVLPPDIVEKILTPTSNAQLQKYIDTMGLMFENANAFMTQMPSYSRIGAGNTTNNNTNSNNNISINGLKVGTDQYQRPFIDVVAEFSQIPRV